MARGQAHFRVRGVNCGRCSRMHKWYKYRVWREGKKIREEYVGKCDQYGHTDFSEQPHQRAEQTSWRDDFNHWQQQQRARPRRNRSPYEVLGVAYTASTADIKKAYRALVKKYHPDLHTHIDPRIIIEINMAYQTLVK